MFLYPRQDLNLHELFSPLDFTYHYNFRYHIYKDLNLYTSIHLTKMLSQYLNSTKDCKCVCGLDYAFTVYIIGLKEDIPLIYPIIYLGR